jgi:hypothetical protein
MKENIFEFTNSHHIFIIKPSFMKRKLTVILIIALSSISFLSNAQLSKKQLKKMNKSASSLFKGQCPLERIEWMKVSEGYDKNAMIAIAMEIQAAAKADADKLKNIAEGNASGNITSEFSKTVNKLQEKQVEVSREFFEQYQMFRAPICNIYQSVLQGFYKNNPEALKSAQAKFIEMNDGWLKYIQEEQKKNQH